MSSRVSRNIPVLYLIKVCKWFMLYMPVVKLFYLENNLNNFDLFFLHGVYSFVIAFSEIPSGYASDVWGRKKAMITGLSLGLVGFGLYSFTYGFWGFLLAEVMLGIGEGFISGTDTALLYDTLQQEKRQHEYLRYEGRITSAGNFAEGLAGIAVTVLAFGSIRNYYYIQTALSFIALIAAFFLTEPVLHKISVKVNWKGIIDTVKNTLWKRPQLSRYVFFSSVIGFASLSMAWFSQIFLYQAGIRKADFGILWTSLNFLVAIGSIVSAKVDKILGQQRSLLYMLIFVAGGFFLASQTISYIGVALLSIFYFARGTAHPILKNHINKLTTSDVRATVLSVRSLSIRILFAGFSPLFGWLTDKISLSFALLLCGITILIPGIIVISGIIRHQKKVHVSA